MDQFHTYRLPDEIENVPSASGGIYHFCLRFPTDYELGLRTPGANVEMIGRRLCGFLEMSAPLFGTGAMSGFARSEAIAKHLQVTYEISSRRADLAKTFALLRKEFLRPNLSIEDLRVATQAIRTAFLASPPIYVGIAVRQSLQSRLQQHLNGESGVSKSLESMKISWRYINFRCAALPGLTTSSATSLEKIVQSIFKPQLSRK